MLDPKSCQHYQLAKLCLLLSNFRKCRLHYLQFTRLLVGQLSTPPLIFPLSPSSPLWTKYFPPFLFLFFFCSVDQIFSSFSSCGLLLLRGQNIFFLQIFFLIFLLHICSFFSFYVLLRILWIDEALRFFDKFGFYFEIFWNFGKKWKLTSYNFISPSRQIMTSGGVYINKVVAFLCKKNIRRPLLTCILHSIPSDTYNIRLTSLFTFGKSPLSGVPQLTF